MNAILFVQFKDAAKASPLGFSVEYPYPVYHIDAVEDAEGQLCAQFLLANREGGFCWVDQADVKRVKGQSQGNGKFQKGRPPFKPRGDNRRFSRKDSSPYPPQEQYVDPQAAQES